MNYCRVKGCQEVHRTHYCKQCKDTDSNHFSSKCPRKNTINHMNYSLIHPNHLNMYQNPRNFIPKCRVRDCNQAHSAHYCKMCKDTDSNHFAKDCMKKLVYDNGYRNISKNDRGQIIGRHNFTSTPKMTKSTFQANERRKTPVKVNRRQPQIQIHELRRNKYGLGRLQSGGGHFKDWI